MRVYLAFRLQKGASKCTPARRRPGGLKEKHRLLGNQCNMNVGWGENRRMNNMRLKCHTKSGKREGGRKEEGKLFQMVEAANAIKRLHILSVYLEIVEDVDLRIAIWDWDLS